MGGIWFPEHLSLLCSGRCPRTTHLGLCLPRRARGPGSFVSLMETRRHGPGQPKCHCTPLFTQLNPTHSEPLHSIQRLRESFLMSFLGVFFGQKIEVLFILLCDTCLSCGQNSQCKLGCSAHSRNAACQRGKKHFPSNSIAAAAAYTSDSRALLCVITA